MPPRQVPSTRGASSVAGGPCPPNWGGGGYGGDPPSCGIARRDSSPCAVRGRAGSLVGVAPPPPRMPHWGDTSARPPRGGRSHRTCHFRTPQWGPVTGPPNGRTVCGGRIDEPPRCMAAGNWRTARNTGSADGGRQPPRYLRSRGARQGDSPSAIRRIGREEREVPRRSVTGRVPRIVGFRGPLQWSRSLSRPLPLQGFPYRGPCGRLVH